jgi:hypothetical protein
MSAKKKSGKTAKVKGKSTTKSKSKPKPARLKNVDAKKRFVDGLVERGQAVEKKTAGQKLPPGATHWLVVDEKTGERRVERGRFSLV